MALISTWVAYPISVIRPGFEKIGDAALLAKIAPHQLEPSLLDIGSPRRR
jgi:hypothetical protein